MKRFLLYSSLFLAAGFQTSALAGPLVKIQCALWPSVPGKPLINASLDLNLLESGLNIPISPFKVSGDFQGEGQITFAQGKMIITKASKPQMFSFFVEFWGQTGIIGKPATTRIQSSSANVIMPVPGSQLDYQLPVTYRQLLSCKFY